MSVWLAARGKFISRLPHWKTACAYCSKPIVWPTLFPGEVVWQTPEKICIKPRGHTGQLIYERASIDHIIPLKHGGTHKLNNLTGSCVSCNLLKDKPLQDLCKICNAQLTRSDTPVICMPCFNNIEHYVQKIKPKHDQL